MDSGKYKRRPEADAATREGEGLTRRDFAMMSVAGGLAATVGATDAATAAAALATAQRGVDIKTPDGICDGVLVHPARSRPSPAVILYPDAMGLRPVKVEMAKRLAGQGYAVLVVNQFYRERRAPVFPPGFGFANPADRTQLMAMMGALDADSVTRDAKAFVTFLDAQPEVDRKARIGAVGFCMGGAMTIRAAAVAPERVGACVSFHGGGLVKDDATSPHRLIPATKAAYHIGIAAADDSKEPASKVTLRETFDAAQRPASIEVYPNTKHGWTVPDSAVYDRAQAERAWAAMLGVYKRNLV